MIISCKNRRNRWGKIAYNKSSLHASREEKAIRGNSGCGGGGRGDGGTRTAHAFEPQVFHDNQGVIDFTFASDWSRGCMRVL